MGGERGVGELNKEGGRRRNGNGKCREARQLKVLISVQLWDLTQTGEQ